jgi:hypothetical protein
LRKFSREGTEVQIKEALARKPGAILRVEDIVDDSIVRELDKSSFIDRIYRYRGAFENLQSLSVGSNGSFTKMGLLDDIDSLKGLLSGLARPWKGAVKVRFVLKPPVSVTKL